MCACDLQACLDVLAALFHTQLLKCWTLPSFAILLEPGCRRLPSDSSDPESTDTSDTMWRASDREK